jgi:AcrR family transcriptional regulator
MAAARPTRRGSREVQRLILDAAHDLFTAQGYHGTKTRQIAERAGVGESVVFHHFESKATLFEATILTPFLDFVSEWARSWERRPPASATSEVIARSYVRGLYAVAEEHRELLLTLLTAQVQGGEPALAAIAADFSAQFADGLFVVRRVLLTQGTARDFAHLDPPVTVAVSAGAIFSVVLMGDWLFPPHERRPSRARQVDELVNMLLYGVSARP